MNSFQLTFTSSSRATLRGSIASLLALLSLGVACSGSSDGTGEGLGEPSDTGQGTANPTVVPGGGPVDVGPTQTPPAVGDGTNPAGGGLTPGAGNPMMPGNAGQQTNGCAAGQSMCGGSCVDFSVDPQNCGACGNFCQGGGGCANGSCVGDCPAGSTSCGGACVDTSVDASNCGGCGTVCPGGSCVAGSCGPDDVPADLGLIGWATVNGNTTGGEGGETVTVTNGGDFQDEISGTASRTVILAGDISGVFEVGSNKTIVGDSANRTLSGGLLIDGQSNLIVQNFAINARSAEDGITVRESDHIWFDHLEIFDAPDGNLDITSASDLITVSWTRFYYTNNPPADDHRFSNLVGAGDQDTADRGMLRITWHHNWWADRVHERAPRVRFGQNHVFNNYYSQSGNNYCVRAGVEAQLLVENNHFDGVGNPHEIDSDNGTATMAASGNLYDGTSGAQDTRGSAFAVPYDYSLQQATSVRAVVMAGAGPQ